MPKNGDELLYRTVCWGQFHVDWQRVALAHYDYRAAVAGRFTTGYVTNRVRHVVEELAPLPICVDVEGNQEAVVVLRWSEVIRC